MRKLADTNIAIVGPGDFGLAIAYCFIKQKANVLLTGRNVKEVTKRASELNIRANVQPMLNTVVDADLVILAAPDNEIEALCKTLTINFKQGAVVAHFSSVLDSSILSCARRKQGVSVCSLHPLNIFPDMDTTMKLLSNRFHRTYLYSEGDKEALRVTGDAFQQIGFVPLEISPQSKPKFHAAAVMARDYLTVLLEASLAIAESAGVDRNTSWRSLQPLIKGTLISIGDRGAEKTIGGPISRGDISTIENHLQVLEEVSVNLPIMYADLGKQALSLAMKRANLDRDSILKIHALLDQVIHKPD